MYNQSLCKNPPTNAIKINKGYLKYTKSIIRTLHSGVSESFV